MTRHQISLSSSQAFYEGISRAFRDPALTSVEADLSGIRYLYPWQITGAACLQRFCRGRVTVGFHWDEAKTSQKEIAAYASDVGLIADVAREPSLQFNPDNYSELYSIEKAEDGALMQKIQGLARAFLSDHEVRTLVELANNVYYHSGREEDSGWGYIQAQKSASRFRLAICDLGVGHYKTYQRSRALHGRSPMEVLESSLRPEAKGSSAAHPGQGLARVCELMDAHRGRMDIYSDGLRCRYAGGRKASAVLGYRTKGTLITIEMPLRRKSKDRKAVAGDEKEFR